MIIYCKCTIFVFHRFCSEITEITNCIQQLKELFASSVGFHYKLISSTFQRLSFKKRSGRVCFLSIFLCEFLTPLLTKVSHSKFFLHFFRRKLPIMIFNRKLMNNCKFLCIIRLYFKFFGVNQLPSHLPKKKVKHEVGRDSMA